MAGDPQGGVSRPSPINVWVVECMTDGQNEPCEPYVAGVFSSERAACNAFLPPVLVTPFVLDADGEGPASRPREGAGGDS